jgi:hypothetical protein
VSQPEQVQESQSFLQAMSEKISECFGKIFKIDKSSPLQIVAVSKETPKVLQGKWNLMPIKFKK